MDTTASFRKAAKKLIKKYPSLKNELSDLSNRLSGEPKIGNPLGNNCFIECRLLEYELY